MGCIKSRRLIASDPLIREGSTNRWHFLFHPAKLHQENRPTHSALRHVVQAPLGGSLNGELRGIQVMKDQEESHTHSIGKCKIRDTFL